jgi:acetylornithine deacetylase/succinyl-diaminopimelate desuccinylase-like protein
MSVSETSIAYGRENFGRFVRELKDFTCFPSVSARSLHAEHIRECGRWLAAHLKGIGVEQVQVVATKGHPIIFGQSLGQLDQPTVLVYGHYDVQLAEPLGEWHSPPCEPEVRGNYLYGRGASDDKGQMFAHLKALEAYLSSGRILPVDVECLFEGEEEIGSPNLMSFIASNQRALSADVAVVSDMPIPAPNRPAITYALRGALSADLEITSPQHDLHSGIFGGAVHNPIETLCTIVAGLTDAKGRVTIPGFYDRVRKSSEQERRYMAQYGPRDEQILRNATAIRPWGDSDYSLYERTTTRPALSVYGISGGYSGPGGKAIIPARAMAKLGFRLVPEQDPYEIDRLFRRHVAAITPPTIHSKIRTNFGANPVIIGIGHWAIRAAAAAYRQGFGAPPMLVRSGGSIPIVNTFHETLGLPTVLMGFALPDDGMHAPNEKFHFPNFCRGVSTSIWFLSELASRQDVKARAVDKSLVTARGEFDEKASP